MGKSEVKKEEAGCRLLGPSPGHVRPIHAAFSPDDGAATAHHANGSAVEFDSILRSFNDEQLMHPSDGKPVMQQQQQIQSKKDDETN
jgi:hypothetical protein